MLCLVIDKQYLPVIDFTLLFVVVYRKNDPNGQFRKMMKDVDESIIRHLVILFNFLNIANIILLNFNDVLKWSRDPYNNILDLLSFFRIPRIILLI